jgi:hypothetical protein
VSAVLVKTFFAASGLCFFHRRGHRGTVRETPLRFSAASAVFLSFILAAALRKVRYSIPGHLKLNEVSMGEKAA